MAIRLNDYYVNTSRRGEHPERWSWEICRRSIPLGIKMTADGFQSEMAAQFAGKRAGRLSGRSIERRKPRPKVRPPQLAHRGRRSILTQSYLSGLMAWLNPDPISIQERRSRSNCAKAVASLKWRVAYFGQRRIGVLVELRHASAHKNAHQPTGRRI
jgi:hypothetical protein